MSAPLLEAADHWVSIGAGVATIVAAAAAVAGITAWRKQVRGTTEYRAAMRCYRAVLRLRDCIRAAREPFNHMVPVYEGESGPETPAFVERERKHYFGYFREVVRADLALLSLRAEAEIHWGTEAVGHIDALDGHARKLRGGYLAYFQHRLKAVSGHPEFAKYAESDKPTIFNLNLTDEDRDAFGEALDATVAQALAYFKSRSKLE